jgi:hypothetical protein
MRTRQIAAEKSFLFFAGIDCREHYNQACFAARKLLCEKAAAHDDFAWRIAGTL